MVVGARHLLRGAVNYAIQWSKVPRAAFMPRVPTSASATLRGLLLVILLTVSLVGATQLNATHIHLPDSSLECELCAGSAPVDVALSSSFHWSIFFVIGLAILGLCANLFVQSVSHYLSRAPPLICK